MENPFDGSNWEFRAYDVDGRAWTYRPALDEQGGVVWLPRLVIDQHDIVAKLLGPVVARQPIETFLIASLSKRLRLVGCVRMSHDDLLESIVSAPETLVSACTTSDTKGVLLVHNHPSGDPRPTTEDYVITAMFALAAIAQGLYAHDHLIVVGDGSYYSFEARRVYSGHEQGA